MSTSRPEVSKALQQALLQYKDGKDGDEEKIIQLIKASDGSMEYWVMFDNLGWTPLEFARMKGYKKLALMLLKNGAAFSTNKGSELEKRDQLKEMIGEFAEYDRLNKQQQKSSSDISRMGRLANDISRAFVGIKDDETALKWVRLSAECDYPYALYNLGSYYYDGIVVQQSFSEALKFYKQSFEKHTELAGEAKAIDAILKIASMPIPGSHGEEKAPDKSADASLQITRGVIFEANEFLVKNYIEFGDLTRALDRIQVMVELDVNRAHDFGDNLLKLVVKHSEFAAGLSAFYGWGDDKVKAPDVAAAKFRKLAEQHKSTPLVSATYYLYRARAYFMDSSDPHALDLAFTALKESYICAKDTLESRRRPIEEILKWTQLVTDREQLSKCLDNLIYYYDQEMQCNPNALPVVEKGLLQLMGNPLLKDVPECWQKFAPLANKVGGDGNGLDVLASFIDKLLQIKIEGGKKEPSGRAELHVGLKNYYHKEMNKQGFDTKKLDAIIRHCQDGLQVRKDAGYQAAYVTALKKAAEITQDKTQAEHYLQEAALHGDVAAMIQLVHQYNDLKNNRGAIKYLQQAITGVANSALVDKFLIELVRVNTLVCDGKEVNKQYLVDIEGILRQLPILQLQKYQKDYIADLKKSAELSLNSGDKKTREKYLTAASEQKDVESMIALTDIYLKRRENENAIKMMQKAVEGISNQPPDAFVHLFSGLANLHETLERPNFRAAIEPQIVTAVEAFFKIAFEKRPVDNQAAVALLEKIPQGSGLGERIAVIKQQAGKEKGAEEERASARRQEEAERERKARFKSDLSDHRNSLSSFIWIARPAEKRGDDEIRAIKSKIDEWMQNEQNIRYYLSDVENNRDKSQLKNIFDVASSAIEGQTSDVAKYAIAKLQENAGRLVQTRGADSPNPDDFNRCYYFYEMCLNNYSAGTLENKLILQKMLLLAKRAHESGITQFRTHEALMKKVMSIAKKADPYQKVDEENSKLAQRILDNIEWRKQSNYPKEEAIIKKMAVRQHAPSIFILAQKNANSTFLRRPDKVLEALSLYLQFLVLIDTDSQESLAKIAEKYSVTLAALTKMKEEAITFVKSKPVDDLRSSRSERAVFARWVHYVVGQIEGKNLPVSAPARVEGAAGTAGVDVEVDVNIIIARNKTQTADVWRVYKIGLQNALGVKLTDKENAHFQAEVKQETQSLVETETGEGEWEVFDKAEAARPPGEVPMVYGGGGAGLAPAAAAPVQPTMVETGSLQVEGVPGFAVSLPSPNMPRIGASAGAIPVSGAAAARASDATVVTPYPAAFFSGSDRAAVAPSAQLAVAAAVPEKKAERPKTKEELAASQAALFAERTLSAGEQRQKAEEGLALAVEGMLLPKASTAANRVEQQEGDGKNKKPKKDDEVILLGGGGGAPGGPKS